MVVNTHYRDNLEAVMQVNKAYTKKEIKKVYIDLGHNTVNTDDHINELTYKVTAPAGAKLLHLMSVGGNSNKIAPATPSDDTTANLKVIPENTYTANVDTVGNTTTKYDPSVASDDTTALVKTMPATVYDFDVNKIKGVSAKYNQLITNSDFTKSANAITITNVNHKLTITGTTTSSEIFNIWLSSDVLNLRINHKYLFIPTNNNDRLRFLGQTYTSDNVFIANKITSNNGIFTDTTNDNYKFQIYFSCRVGITYNDECYINLIDLTDVFGAGNEPSTVEAAIPLLKAKSYKLDGTDTYSTGEIRNLELTSVDVEGKNLINLQDAAETTTRGITYKIENGTIFLSGTATADAYITIYNRTLKAGSYCLKDFGNIAQSWDASILYTDVSGWNTLSPTKTLDSDTSVYFVIIVRSGITINGYYKPMLVKGSTAPTEFEPYVSQTLPIDLTSIEDSGGNKLFADGSLKGVNDIYDEITPYKAKKRISRVKAKDLTWQLSTINNIATFVYDLTSAKATTDNTVVSNLLINGYKTVTPNANYAGGNKTISLAGVGSKVIWLHDNDYNDATTFKNHFTDDDYILFELNEYIETNIDFSFLKNIQGYSNGSITAQNTYDMAVPSEIRYNSKIENDYADSVVFSGNLLLLTDGTETNYGITYAINSGAIGVNGTATTAFYKSLKTLTLQPGTYYFKSFGATGSNSTYFICLQDTNDNTHIVGYTYNNGSFTITETTTFAYLLVVRNGTNVPSGTQFKDILVKGSTAPTAYRPYVAPITKQIASEIKALDGYNYGVSNTCFNYVDFNNKKFNKVVGRISLENLNWIYESTDRLFYCSIDIRKSEALYYLTNLTNIYSDYGQVLYPAFKNNAPDNSFSVQITGKYMNIKDSSLNGDINALKAKIAGLYLYCELETKVLTDISQYLADFNPILTNNNYTHYEVISHNGSALPNKVSYIGTIKDTLVESVTVEGLNRMGVIDKEETTSSGITFKAQDGTISIKNTPSSNISLWFEIEPLTLENGANYLFKNFYNTVSSYISIALRKSRTDSGDGVNLNQSGTSIIGNGQTYNYFLIYITTGFSGSLNWQPMIVRGITAPTIFKQYKETITRLLPNSVAKYGWGINANVHNTRIFSDYEGETVSEGELSVGNQDMGGLNWNYENNERFIVGIAGLKNYPSRNTTVLCSKYDASISGTDKYIFTANGNIYIYDSAYNNAAIFKNAKSGEMLKYEKASTDKETINDFDYFFDVDEGDIITFNNANAQQCYASYSFLIKEAKSNE